MAWNPTCGCPVNAPEADPSEYDCPCGAHCPTCPKKGPKIMSYADQFLHPTFINRATGKVVPNDTGWQTRHVAALRTPRDFESAIVGMIRTWALYADTHRARYETGIGNDAMSGDAWQAIGRSIRDLLNGETGRLDCGTLDGFIVDTLASEGFHV